MTVWRSERRRRGRGKAYVGQLQTLQSDSQLRPVGEQALLSVGVRGKVIRKLGLCYQVYKCV